MEVAILNYSIGNVVLETLPDEVEDIDTYLEEVFNYDTDNIEWMCNEDHIEILDGRDKTN